MNFIGNMANNFTLFDLECSGVGVVVRRIYNPPVLEEIVHSALDAEEPDH